MGQNQCCTDKDYNKNIEYNPRKTNKPNKTVSKKIAEDVLASITKKKLYQLPTYELKDAKNNSKGIFSDTYEQIEKPKGYYHGEWSNNNHFHGKGQFFFEDGSYYQGTFVEGVAQGEGRYIFNNGCIYEGEIKNNEANGEGIYDDPFQSYCYEGFWVDDVPEGKGKEKFANGSYYEGEFHDGVKHGYGHYVCNSGVYKGQFVNGNFNGQGTFSYIDNRTYKGQWKDGLLSGYGIFTWPDGNKFQGQYLNGLKHGKGTFYFANGKIFKGRWKNGLKHGQGELKIANQIVKGVWKDGELQTALDDNQQNYDEKDQ